MSSFKEKFKKIWNGLIWGSSTPGRVFVHDKKVYVLERNYNSLNFSSQSILKFVLKSISSILRQPPVIIGLLGGVGFAAAGIISGETFLAVLGIMFITLSPYAIVQLYTGSDEGSIPVLTSGPHQETSEYAGEKAVKVAEVLSSLTKEQIVQMVENLEELRKVEDLLDEAEVFLADNPGSLLASDVRAQIDMLKAQEKKLLQSQKLDESMRIYNKEIAYKKEEKAINLLQQVSQYTSEMDSSFTETSLALQNSEIPCVEEVSVPMAVERSRAR